MSTTTLSHPIVHPVLGLIDPFTKKPLARTIGSPVYRDVPRSLRQIRRREIPLSSWAPACHPLVEKVTHDVDAWFLENWHFENEKAAQKFVAAGFSRVTCLYYPLAKDDRINFACRLLAILFLIDGMWTYPARSRNYSHTNYRTLLSRPPRRYVPGRWQGVQCQAHASSTWRHTARP